MLQTPSVFVTEDITTDPSRLFCRGLQYDGQPRAAELQKFSPLLFFAFIDTSLLSPSPLLPLPPCPVGAWIHSSSQLQPLHQCVCKVPAYTPAAEPHHDAYSYGFLLDLCTCMLPAWLLSLISTVMSMPRVRPCNHISACLQRAKVT